MNDASSLHERIAMFRKILRMNQQDFYHQYYPEESNRMARWKVEQWESGKREPPVKVIDHMNRYFQSGKPRVTPCFVCGGSGKVKVSTYNIYEVYSDDENEPDDSDTKS